MLSTITSKYQTTIPKAVREHLGLSIKDSIEWQVSNGTVTVVPVKARFLDHRNTVLVGPGDIEEDLRAARSRRLDAYR